jgi:predicted DCC family thiol-disulfide oxidoreductase YuxK
MARQPDRPGLPHSGRVIVWHDGACPLCRREIAVMRRLDADGAIRFVDVRDADGLSPAERAWRLGRFHVEEDGQMLTGAAAFAAMWRAIPALRPLGLAARNPAVLATLEWGYLCFLRLRPMLQGIAAWRDRREI